MALYMIGIGLGDEKDITLRGLEAVKHCDKVFLETYTSLLQCSVADLEKLYGKKIIPADRELVEKNAEQILSAAKNEDAAFLVIGDPMSATTHMDIYLRAREKNIPVIVIHNASVLTAVGIVGLQLYKYGKTTSLPFDASQSLTAYSVIADNSGLRMHTLVLLDLNPSEKKYLTVQQAIKHLLAREEEQKRKIFTAKTLCIGCARLGSDSQKIIASTAEELSKEDLGPAPHCLIIPGKLHFMEEEAIGVWKK